MSLNPKTTHFEFLGPPGAFAITILVPSVIYALFFACSESTQCRIPLDALDTIPTRVSLAVLNPEWWKSLLDLKAFAIYLAWYAFCLVAWYILPGEYVQGTTLRTGEKKTYKINGTFSVFS
jgi:Delta14-sterol reductase